MTGVCPGRVASSRGNRCSRGQPACAWGPASRRRPGAERGLTERTGPRCRGGSAARLAGSGRKAEPGSRRSRPAPFMPTELLYIDRWLWPKRTPTPRIPACLGREPVPLQPEKVPQERHSHDMLFLLSPGDRGTPAGTQRGGRGEGTSTHANVHTRVLRLAPHPSEPQAAGTCRNLANGLPCRAEAACRRPGASGARFPGSALILKMTPAVARFHPGVNLARRAAEKGPVPGRQSTFIVTATEGRRSQPPGEPQGALWAHGPQPHTRNARPAGPRAGSWPRGGVVGTARSQTALHTQVTARRPAGHLLGALLPHLWNLCDSTCPGRLLQKLEAALSRKFPRALKTSHLSSTRNTAGTGKAGHRRSPFNTLDKGIDIPPLSAPPPGTSPGATGLYPAPAPHALGGACV